MLETQPRILSNIARLLNSTVQEISRHMNRLSEIGVVVREPTGSWRLTNYGETLLRLLPGFQFVTRNLVYFNDHSVSKIPSQFFCRLGSFHGSSSISSTIDFFREIGRIIDESNDRVWMITDKFPVILLRTIMNALERGVNFRFVESFDLYSQFEDTYSREQLEDLNFVKLSPNVEFRAIKNVDITMVVSDTSCAVAFPLMSGEFDHKGFLGKGLDSQKWSEDIFTYYWENSSPREYVSSVDYIQRLSFPDVGLDDKREIIIEGKSDPTIDQKIVQDAVNNYEIIILKGSFNFGDRGVLIQNNTIIRGEGRKNDIPQTYVFKDPLRWTFPSTELDYVFCIDGKDIDVQIENITFSDFNGECILGLNGNSIVLRDNRITIISGGYRARTIIPIGDVLWGILIMGNFPGGVEINGNYIDLAESYAYGGFHQPGLRTDETYRPNIIDHTYWSSSGITVRDVSGSVKVTNNEIRHFTSCGICTYNNALSSDVIIIGNKIISDVWGAYYIDHRWAGCGIHAFTALDEGQLPGRAQIHQKGYNLKIAENQISCGKPNFVGILLSGLIEAPIDSEKLSGGTIKGNHIHLGNGAIGMHFDSCDKFDIIDNIISGRAYYGISISSRTNFRKKVQGAFQNRLINNSLEDLEIKSPDKQSYVIFDREIRDINIRNSTAHIFLGKNTARNLVRLNFKYCVIDEGEENNIHY